jgi:hypothetical protein
VILKQTRVKKVPRNFGSSLKNKNYTIKNSKMLKISLLAYRTLKQLKASQSVRNHRSLDLLDVQAIRKITTIIFFLNYGLKEKYSLFFLDSKLI